MCFTLGKISFNIPRQVGHTSPECHSGDSNVTETENAKKFEIALETFFQFDNGWEEWKLFFTRPRLLRRGSLPDVWKKRLVAWWNHLEIYHSLEVPEPATELWP